MSLISGNMLTGNRLRVKTCTRIAMFFAGFIIVSLLLPRTAGAESRPLSKLSPLLKERVEAAGLSEKLSAWIFFTDKGVESRNMFQALASAENNLSAAARLRRGKMGSPILTGEYDIPVNEAYVSQVSETGATIRVRSKWLNCISVSATGKELREISSLPFVSEIRPVGKRMISPDRLVDVVPAPAPGAPISTPAVSNDAVRTGHSDGLPGTSPTAAPADYGQAWGQLEMIQIPTLHDFGFHGEGIVIGILDTGFNLNHEALLTTNVIAKWDFINSDSIVSNQAGQDASSQQSHGTYILGEIGGKKTGTFLGGAYAARFVLGKTEIVTEEIPAEEDLWVRGLEWEESLGVDVISSSLGYIDWYTYQDMDGNTAVTTRAADLAAGLGVVLVNAMGNSGGSSYPYMIAPADGDSVISAGAVNSNQLIAYFSSRGPTYDQRIKPDVCAQGVSTYTVSPSDPIGYTYISGTSASTPLVACACALLLQAHPFWTPMQVLEALKATASRSSSPDTAYGWGVVRAYDAYLYSPVSVTAGGTTTESYDAKLTVSPNPSSSSFSILWSGQRPDGAPVRIYDVRGSLVRTLSGNAGDSRVSSFPWDGRDSYGTRVSSGVYFVVVQSNKGVVMRKAVVLR